MANSGWRLRLATNSNLQLWAQHPILGNFIVFTNHVDDEHYDSTELFWDFGWYSWCKNWATFLGTTAGNCSSCDCIFDASSRDWGCDTSDRCDGSGMLSQLDSDQDLWVARLCWEEDQLWPQLRLQEEHRQAGSWDPRSGPGFPWSAPGTQRCRTWHSALTRRWTGFFERELKIYVDVMTWWLQLSRSLLLEET